ncbi:hypothetical protein VKT23_015775 [Stygiomarasmius scandens]|uniref:Uncharacterized protein n=1 Tax=Marasmiellus scandens TaxID=2682957 RepID=A0ABR1IWH1_9AGAR
MTPSFRKALGQKEVEKFLDVAVNYWSKRFPTDVLPGCPRDIFERYDKDIHKVELAIMNTSWDGFRKHLLSRLQENLTDSIETRSPDFNQFWYSELMFALRSYDVHYPCPFKTNCPSSDINIPWHIVPLEGPIPQYYTHLLLDPPYVKTVGRYLLRWDYISDKKRSSGH